MLRFEGLPRLIVVMTEQELTRQIIALRDPMFRFARTLLLRRDEAEDAVADVVARLWSAPQRMIGCRDLRAFALTAVRNRCYDLLRQRQAGARRADALTGMAEPTATNPVERWEARELVRAAMAKLPHRQREAPPPEGDRGIRHPRDRRPVRHRRSSSPRIAFPRPLPPARGGRKTDAP